MKYLDLSYNSLARAGARALLQMHATLRASASSRRSRRRARSARGGSTRAPRGRSAARSSSRAPSCSPVRHVRAQRGHDRARVALDGRVRRDHARGCCAATRCSDAQLAGLARRLRARGLGNAILANGFCDIYGLKGMNPRTVDLKDKERSARCAASRLRGSAARQLGDHDLTLASVNPEHVELLAEALSTNTTITSPPRAAEQGRRDGGRGAAVQESTATRRPSGSTCGRRAAPAAARCTGRRARSSAH